MAEREGRGKRRAARDDRVVEIARCNRKRTHDRLTVAGEARFGCLSPLETIGPDECQRTHNETVRYSTAMQEDRDRLDTPELAAAARGVEPLASFAPWSRRSPFGDAAGPLLYRRDARTLTFATQVEHRHGNARGHAHAGMITTFADLVLGYAAAFSTDPPTSLVTASLTTDFMTPIAIGKLLIATPEVLRVGRRMAYAQATIVADDAPVARCSAALAVI